MKADLHMHSTASDGVLKSSELVRIAKEKNLDVIAITDHDSIAGIDDALIEGEKLNIKVIPAIELSTNYKGENIHILGYFKDSNYKAPELIKFLDDMKTKRLNRAKKMVENIREIHNINITFEDVQKKAKGIIARPHMAKAIIESGCSYSWDYIFNNIIGNDCPAYVPSVKLPLQEGINLLRKHNALVILAHPTLLKSEIFEEVITFDFDGLEAIYPQNKINTAEKFTNIAKKKGMLITAGSDFHGELDVDTKHNDMATVVLKDSDLRTFLSKLNS